MYLMSSYSILNLLLGWLALFEEPFVVVVVAMATEELELLLVLACVLLPLLCFKCLLALLVHVAAGLCESAVRLVEDDEEEHVNASVEAEAIGEMHVPFF